MVRRLDFGRSAVVLVFLVLVSLAVVGIRFLESDAAESRVTTKFEPLTGPALAVLAFEPPRIVLLDLETLAVQREISLRSESIDIEARGGVLVTAQCGGPGAASDTAVAIIEPDAGAVAYVDTGALDAERVSPWGSESDSRWLVVHGEVRDGVSAGAIVDTGLLTARDAALPAGILCTANVKGSVWATGLTGDESGDDLTEGLFIGDDQGWRLVDSVLDPVCAILETEEGALLVQRLGNGATRISVRDQQGREVRAGEIRGFDAGVGRACMVRPDLLAIADSDWRDPERSGEQVLLVDTQSLTLFGSIKDTPGPVALSANAGALFVGCEATGEVVRVDPDTGAVLARTQSEHPLVDLVDMTVWRGGV